ncbi:MAG: hypothetical protein ACLVBP_15615 [Ruminococcus sp.]
MMNQGRLEMLKDSGAMVLSVTGDGTDSKIKLEKADARGNLCTNRG